MIKQKPLTLVKIAVVTLLTASLGLGCKKDSSETPEKPEAPPPAGFVRINGGTFTMGSSGATDSADEKPAHNVTLKPFHMSKIEVTQEDFFKFLAAYDTNLLNVDQRKPKNYYQGTGLTVVDSNPQKPVLNVRFITALRYANWKSQTEGFTQVYTINVDGTIGYNTNANGYRLPTEAEWEFAARAGSQNAYCFGNDTNLLNNYAAYSSNSSGFIFLVAQKTANAFGLYDMHGNAYEWCWDWYAPYSGDAENPIGPTTGTERVYRGGSSYDKATSLRSAKRFKGSQGWKYETVGMRPLLKIYKKEKSLEDRKANY